MPQLYKDPGRCFGCAACAAACPSKAVEMKRDAMGFQYPLVNAELCSECGLCASVCPALNPLPS
ncbi:MAG: 4Fe-4S binding protein, partial [Firmicutes bacterium]|nr:4Fe-4S binding protein [Bacillota bacterium]